MSQTQQIIQQLNQARDRNLALKAKRDALHQKFLQELDQVNKENESLEAEIKLLEEYTYHPAEAQVEEPSVSEPPSEVSSPVSEPPSEVSEPKTVASDPPSEVSEPKPLASDPGKKVIKISITPKKLTPEERQETKEKTCELVGELAQNLQQGKLPVRSKPTSDLQPNKLYI